MLLLRLSFQVRLSFLDLIFLDSFNDLLSLPFLLFLLSQSNEISFFDLFDDLGVPDSLLLFLSFLQFFVVFDFFEPFNFEHQILSFLLHLLFFDDFLLLLQLLVSDRDAFHIINHRVHFLHLIKVLVHLLIGTVYYGFLLSELLLLRFSQWNLFLLLFFEHEHFLFFRFGSCLLLFLLLLKNLFLVQLLLLGGDNGVVLHPLKLTLTDQHHLWVGQVALFDLLCDFFGFLVQLLCVGFSGSEKCFIHFRFLRNDL